MGRPRKDPNSGMMVAREAIVVVVGARPPEYEQITVTDRKTGNLVTMNSDRMTDQGSLGRDYTFKPYQRVPANHPAVKDCPAAFMPISELGDAELELVTS